MADDMPIEFDRMRLWDEDTAAAYFEGGGGALAPPPLLVCLYSAGLTPAQGRSLMGRMMKAAVHEGVVEETLVLDHYTEYPECATFDQ